MLKYKTMLHLSLLFMLKYIYGCIFFQIIVYNMSCESYYCDPICNIEQNKNIMFRYQELHSLRIDKFIIKFLSYRFVVYY